MLSQPNVGFFFSSFLPSLFFPSFFLCEEVKMADSVKPLYYKGCSHFRQRLVCSTLAGRKVVISGIRGSDQQPGLRDFEASFLRLLEKITNGCRIEINMTGTTVSYTPGVLIGRPKIQHECPTSRSIGYFLEPLIMLLPFAKLVTSVELTGVTNDRTDRSVDLIRTVTLPTLSTLFNLPVDGLQLKVKTRGAPPLGGGVVEFTCPVVQKLKNGNLLDFGEVRRVRGIAYCTRVSPQVMNRMRDVSKSVLTKYAKDVFIYTDYYKGDESGNSPGFALSLVAETTTGCLLGAESVAGEGEGLPEDVGAEAVKKLLCEVMGMGCVDTPTQHFILLYMVLCPAEVSQIKMGQLSPFTMQFMRMLRDFFGVEFRVEEEDEGVVLSCVGVGFENIARKMK